MLSMETSLLPAAYQQELCKSYHQVPSLGRPLVRKLIVQELGSSPENLFNSFNTTAMAAASLGQVHAATNYEGKALAVKLQYPGIDVSIKNDLKIVRAIVKRTKPANLLLTALDEIEARLYEEVDYRREAKNTHWFYVSGF